jgi:AAA15 family ATPase/GTPase
MNLKKAELNNLMDLNIIIGPNNCGKTSILKGINLLQRPVFGRYGPWHCEQCGSVLADNPSLLNLDCKMDPRECFLGKHKVSITFEFNIEEIGRTFPHFVDERDKVLNTVLALEDENQFRNEIDQTARQTDAVKRILNAEEFERIATRNAHARKEFAEPRLVIVQDENQRLRNEHLSFLINQEFREDVLQTMIFCPDARLDRYKGEDVPGYIRSKNFPASEQTRMVQFLKDLVDTKLVDMRQNMELVRIVEDERFDTTIAEQGSGVKSLICLVADILAGTQNKILLIDEPELGLNSSGKQAFLRFLLTQSREKQIFIATHDPTFVNPLLWGREGVSFYLYSIPEGKFVKVNLEESKTDPNTFAGYLPHTTSLKQVHIYVEGSRDVYIFQTFLEKYLKENFDDWYEVINRIGIYHLAGDFWTHLLYTIPEKPYSSIVVLDGDKRELAGNIINKYDSAKNNRFHFYTSVSEMEKLLHNSKSAENDVACPVVCLKRSEIEDYLEPKPVPKEKGPIIAQEMESIPEEITQIFSITLRSANIEPRKRSSTH